MCLRTFLVKITVIFACHTFEIDDSKKHNK